MVLFLTQLFFSFSIHAEPLKIVHYKTIKEIDSFYCKITTGSPRTLAKTPCSTPNHYPFDIIYIPEKIAEAILEHVESARAQKYFKELSNSDYFHGHPLRSGTNNNYSSPQEFFDDIKAMLYHSDEYTSNWYEQSLTEPDPLKRIPRSFYGWVDNPAVYPAIQGMPQASIPPQYDSSGTIYSEQLTKGLFDLSSVQLNDSDKIYINTGETQAPCKVLDQIYLLRDSDGRFLTKNNERLELFIQCKYLPRR